MKKAIFFLVMMVAFAWLVWTWGFCRFYVQPGYMAVITAKGGKALSPDQILAHEGQKGVRENVLGEGRHFLNPILFEHKIQPVIKVLPGKVGIVTAGVGANLPEDDFLAEEGQKGIWRRVLGPGTYRMNPVGYQVDLVDATPIPIGYAGVMTALSGRQAPEGEFAKAGEKGVRQDILQPGLYYINPREISVNVLEIGVNQVSLLGKMGSAVLTKGQIMTDNAAMNVLQQSQLSKQAERRADYLSQQSATASGAGSRGVSAESKMAPQMQVGKPRVAVPKQAQLSDGNVFVLSQFVEFPSRDGFEISLDMTVEFELLPKNIAWLYRSYGDLPAVVDKVIMPQILSVSRLKGSAYGAKDFIVGEGREKFQNDLTDTLARTLADRRINIHSALIRHVNVPMQILDPIQQASLAMEMDLTNKEKQNTAKIQAQLNTEMSLIEQRRETVAQETEKIKAEILAEQEKEVAQIAATTIKQVADVAKQTAGVQAERTMRLGKAEADAYGLVEGEKAMGAQIKIKAFDDPMAYNLWVLATSLNPQIGINILHAGDGTLWTDLKDAQLGDLGGAEVIRKKKEAAPAAK